MTTGATQAIGLIAQLYLRRNARVVVESPSWPGCLDIFRAAGARLAGVPLDADGVRPDALPAALSGQRPDLLFVMPTFHNPTGTLMSAARFGVPVLEDIAYLAGPSPSPACPSRSGVASGSAGCAPRPRSSTGSHGSRPWPTWAARCWTRPWRPGCCRASVNWPVAAPSSAGTGSPASPTCSASACRPGGGGCRTAVSRCGSSCPTPTREPSPPSRCATVSRWSPGTRRLHPAPVHLLSREVLAEIVARLARGWDEFTRHGPLAAPRLEVI